MAAEPEQIAGQSWELGNHGTPVWSLQYKLRILDCGGNCGSWWKPHAIAGRLIQPPFQAV